MWSCEFCNETLDNQNALQAHQLMSCPAVEQRDFQVKSPESAAVRFKWIMDRVISYPEIHLISSDLGDAIQLKKGNGCYSSDPIQVRTGVYNAQLVIENDVLSLAEFEVDLLSETVYVVIEQDTSVEFSSSLQEDQNRPPDENNSHTTLPSISSSATLQTVGTPVPPRRASEEGLHDGPEFSTLYRELLEHEMQNPGSNDIGNILSEENVPAADDTVATRHHGFTQSPDNHTMQNIDDLRDDQQSFISHHAQEHQQPIESEAEDLSDCNNRISTEGNQNGNSSVEEILHELSLTDAENIIPNRQGSVPVETDDEDVMRDIPRLPSEPSFQGSSAQHEFIQHEIEDAMQEFVHRPSFPDDNLLLTSHDNDVTSAPATVNINEQISSGVPETLPPSLPPDLYSQPDWRENTSPRRPTNECEETPPRANQNTIPDVLRSIDTSGVMERPFDSVPNSNTNNVITSLSPEQERGRHEIERQIHRRSASGSMDGYVSDGSSATEQPHQTAVRAAHQRSRRSRSHSTEQHHEASKDNMISELHLRCQAYETESIDLKKEVDRLKDLIENFKEVQVELKTKCDSYDEEVERWKEKYAVLLKETRNARDKSTDNTGQLLRENAKLKARCQLYEGERGKATQNYDVLFSKFKKAMIEREIVSELEAKCQSYDMEVGRLKTENTKLQEKFGERALRELQLHLLESKTVNAKLSSDNKSLELAHQMHAEELTKEIKRLERKVEVMEREKAGFSDDSSDPGERSKMCIMKLKSENEFLKDKLHNIRQETAHISATQAKENLNEGYQPQILSPGHSPRSAARTSDHMANRLFSAILPNRVEHRQSSSNYDNDDSRFSRTRSARYNRDTHATFQSPKDMSFTSHSKESTRVRYDTKPRHADTYSDGFLDMMNKKYPFNSNLKAVDDLLADSASKSYRTGSARKAYERDFDDSYTNTNRVKRHPKSRSLDYGLDEAGLEQEPVKRYSSLPRIPFCPTTIRDLCIGMKVSVNRTNNRLSRGTVQWIGHLPQHVGDYVGIELETETGKHNGHLDGVQYFKCKRDCGVFVKFPKIIMAWK